MLRIGIAIVSVQLLVMNAGIAQVDSNGSERASPHLTEARLCIHNGGEYYTNGPFFLDPWFGGGKYFPSFTHWTATPVAKGGGLLIYPWKIRGWGWTGMQAMNFSPIWVWQSCLMGSPDAPYSSGMSWDYPVLYLTGAVSHTGFPNPIVPALIPPKVPVIGGNRWILPSGGGGSYQNIFAAVGATWVLPSTQPFYGYEFGVSFNCGSALTVPSSSSIWEYVWATMGPNGQYLILSGNEVDCMGGGGNKGRNYSLIGAPTTGYLWAWLNGCSGIGVEWAMCLFVCDAVTIPINIPGASNPANPFSAYGFDVGVATLTPLLSSGGVQLGFMTEDGSGIGGSRIALASFAPWPCVGPYGKMDFRIPHGFDVFTSWLLNFGSTFLHTPAPGYPGCMFGNTFGAHGAFVSFPSNPLLLGAEIRYSSFATAKGAPMSASYMATYF